MAWREIVIVLDVEVTFEEYFHANEIWISTNSLWQRVWFWTFMYVLPVIGTVSFLAGGLLICQSRSVTTPAIPFLMWGFCGWWCRLGFKRRVRKVYDQQAPEFSQRMEITKEGLVSERKDGSASIKYSWNGIVRWIEKPDFFSAISEWKKFYNGAKTAIE